MRRALKLARRGEATVSPNPMVGAILVKGEVIIGQGWHKQAGQPHAEVEALTDAQKKGHNPRGATLYVTLEPCSTHGRTPPCTEAMVKAGIKKVYVGALDPNPRHNGRGLKILRRAGIQVVQGVLGAECEELNAPFNHWVTEGTPFVTVKAAMTLDGKIATRTGESKWITGAEARDYSMGLREVSDAILVGVNTVIADNPRLTFRGRSGAGQPATKQLRRYVLDSRARTPLQAAVVSDEFRSLTTIVIGAGASRKNINDLRSRANVLIAPTRRGKIDLGWLMNKMGTELQVTRLLVEGGGEVNASFLMQGLAQRIAFFYAPKILGGRDSRPGVAGEGAKSLTEVIRLENLIWRWLGKDLLLTARLSAHP